jgi:hypothetical protein
MKKLGMLGIIGGAALLTAAPFSLQWSQDEVSLSLSSANARPLTNIAGVHRRVYRRTYAARLMQPQRLEWPDMAMAHITAIALRTIPATTRRSRTRRAIP